MNLGLGLWLLILVSASASPTQQDGKKPSWEWSLDERVTARLNPTNMRARLRPSGAQALRQMPLQEGQYPTTDYVDGSRNPELLLPWELFNSLLARAFSQNPQTQSVYRETLETRARAAGLRPDIWSTVESCATSFLQAKREEAELGARLPGTLGLQKQALLDQIAQIQEPQCGRRAAALACARAALGTSSFNRYLYEVVAPSVTVTSVGDKERQSHLLFAEGGCQ